VRACAAVIELRDCWNDVGFMMRDDNFGDQNSTRRDRIRAYQPYTKAVLNVDTMYKNNM
jgi:hypothetical protein